MLKPSEVRNMTPQALILLGAMETAYIRRIETEFGVQYALYRADGVELAVADTRDLAFVAARQNGLQAVSAH